MTVNISIIKFEDCICPGKPWKCAVCYEYTRCKIDFAAAQVEAYGTNNYFGIPWFSSRLNTVEDTKKKNSK